MNTVRLYVSSLVSQSRSGRAVNTGSAGVYSTDQPFNGSNSFKPNLVAGNDILYRNVSPDLGTSEDTYNLTVFIYYPGAQSNFLIGSMWTTGSESCRFGSHSGTSATNWVYYCGGWTDTGVTLPGAAGWHRFDIRFNTSANTFDWRINGTAIASGTEEEIQ